MTNEKKLRILFLGTRKLGYLGLERLIKKGFTISAVITNDYEITEGYDAQKFKELCQKNNIPFFISEKIHNGPVYEAIKEIGFDMGVSLYWRRLIKTPLIKLARAGFINAHAADLPRYRGFAATSWAILLGESYCGLCVHEVVSGIADNGRIFKRCRIPLTDTSTIKSLMEDVIVKAIDMTEEVLKEQQDIWPKLLKGETQDESQALLAYPRLPQDGEIDWKMSAQAIDRHVRSVTHPYPGAFTFLNGQRMYVWNTSVEENPPAFVGQPGHVVEFEKNGPITVVTGKGLLKIHSVSFAEKEDINPGEIIKSVQVRLGMNHSLEIEALKMKLEQLLK